MLRSWVTMGAVALCLAACTKRNPNAGADGTVSPDSSTSLDGWSGGEGTVNPDGFVPGDGPSTADLPSPRDLPGPADGPLPPDLAVVPDGPSVPDQAVPPDQALPPDLPGPPDLPTGGCTTNADCPGKNQFCELLPGCVPPGTCAKKPTNCSYVYDPVCGCDDKDYSNPCLANAAGVSVKHKGQCITAGSCGQIRTDYSAAVAAAKACSPMLPVVQCVTVVTKDLACGCSTAVNKNNLAAYTTLLALEQQWKALKCDKQPWMCPAIPCQVVTSGKCSASTGQCVDVP